MADQLLSDAEVSAPAPKLLSDDEVSTPAAPARAPYPDDPVSTGIFQQSPSGSLWGAATGAVKDRLNLTVDAIKNEFTNGGLSDSSIDELTKVGKLEDYKNQQAEWQHTINGAITMPSAAIGAAGLVGADYALRTLNAGVSGVATLMGGEGGPEVVNESIFALQSSGLPGAEAFSGVLERLRFASAISETGVPIKTAGPSLKEMMTLPVKTVEKDEIPDLREQDVFTPENAEATLNPKSAPNIYDGIKEKVAGMSEEEKSLRLSMLNKKMEAAIITPKEMAERDAIAAKVSTAPVIKAPVANPMIDEDSGNLNLKYIHSTDDVLAVQARARQAIADRDGVVISNGVTKEEGMEMVNKAAQEQADGIPPELANRMRGDPATRAEIYASRYLAAQSAQEVWNLGEIAKKTGDARDYAALEEADGRMMTINGIDHDIAATQGRDFQSRKIPVGDETARTVLTGMDKGDRMRTVMTLPNPQGVAKALQTMKKPGWSDMAIFHYVSWLLSNPVTHAAYAAAGEVQKFVRYGEQAISTGIGAVQRAAGYGLDVKEYSALQKERTGIETTLAAADRGALKLKASESGQMEIRLKEIIEKQKMGETRMPDEIAGRLYGVGKGYIDGARAAGRALVSGNVQMFPSEEAAAQEAGKKASAAALEEGKSAEEARKAGDAAYSQSAVKMSNPIMERAQFIKNPLYKGLVQGYGRIVGISPAMAGAIHTFQKFAGFTESRYALVYQRAALMGEAGEEEMGARIAKLLSDTPDDILKQAAEDGKYASLVNRPGALGQNIENLAHTNAWTRFVIPFARIATNLTSQTLLERTPAGLLSSEIRARLSGTRGAVAQSDAIARMALGTGVATTGASLAAQGIVNGIGASKPGERAENYMTGKPPLSVRIGNHAYPLRLFGVPGRIISYGAAAHDIYQGYEGGDDLWDATGHMIHTISDTALQENALKGLSDFLDAVVGHDAELSKRYALNAAAAVIVPRGVAQITRLDDPYMRSTMGNGFMDRLQKTVDAQLPWKSQSLLPQVDVYGRDMLRNTDYEKAMQDPVTQAELRTQQYPTRVEPRINNVKLTDQQYYDYQKKAGAAYYANVQQMVSDDSFANRSIDTQKDMIHTAMINARAMARQDMMLNDPNLAQSIADYQQKLIDKRSQQ